MKNPSSTLSLALLASGCFAYSAFAQLHVEEEFRYRNGGGDIGSSAVDATGAPGGFGTYSNYDGVDTATTWDFTIHTGSGFNLPAATGFVPQFDIGDNLTWQASSPADEQLWRSSAAGTGLSIYSGTGIDFGLLDSGLGGSRGGSLFRSSQNLYSSASRNLDSGAIAALTTPQTTVYFAMVIEAFTNSDADNDEAGNFGFAFASADFGSTNAIPELTGTGMDGIGFRAFAPDPADPVDPLSAQVAATLFYTSDTGSAFTTKSDEKLYFAEGETFMVIGKIEWGGASGTEPDAVLGVAFDPVDGDLDLAIPSETGYNYQLQENPGASSWTNSGVIRVGSTGSDATWNRAIPAGGDKVFYRVLTNTNAQLTLYKVTAAQAASTYTDLSAFDSISVSGTIDATILDRITFYDNRKNKFDTIRFGDTPIDVAPGIIIPAVLP